MTIDSEVKRCDKEQVAEIKFIKLNLKSFFNRFLGKNIRRQCY